MNCIRGCLIAVILNTSVATVHATDRTMEDTASAETIVVTTPQVMNLGALISVSRLNRNLRVIDMSDRVLLAKPYVKPNNQLSQVTSDNSSQSEE